MTTLNIDLAIAETAYGKMANFIKKWAEFQKLNRTYMRDSLYEAENWMGASAKNFYDTYNEVDSQINAQLQEYAKLTAGFYNEMLEWIKKAEHLSSASGPRVTKFGPFTIETPPPPQPLGQVTVGGVTVDIPPNSNQPDKQP
jgi:hypothetical protein